MVTNMGEIANCTSLPYSGMLPLDVLAEVATETLRNDPTLNCKSDFSDLKPHNDVEKPTVQKRSATSNEALSLEQIRHLSDKMLLEMFSEHSSDEIRRYFSYKCYLIPEKCEKVFSSFGSETKARLQMKSHLLSHVSQLLADAKSAGIKSNSSFVAEPLNVRQRKLQESAKKRRKNRLMNKRVKHSSQKHATDGKSNISRTRGLKGTDAKVPNVKKFPFSVKSLTGLRTSSAVNGKYPTRVKKASRSNISDKKMEKENHESYCSPFEELCRAIQKVDASFEESIQSDLDKINGCQPCTELKSSDINNNSKPVEVENGNKEQEQPSNKEDSFTMTPESAESQSTEKCEEHKSKSSEEVSSQSLLPASPLLEPVPANSSKPDPMFYPQHDHTYTSPDGKTYTPESGESVKNIIRLSKERGKNSHKCCSVPIQLIIPTAPFPYLYVPILPHISEVKEIGNSGKRSCDKCCHNGVTVIHHVKKSSGNQDLPPPILKPVRMRRVNKVIIPEEMESDVEDDENVPFAFTADCIENSLCETSENEERIPSCESSVLKPERHTSDVTHFGERKLALKCIRALRTKKKDERGPLVCQICKDKSFTAQATLMYHYRSHAGIKPFVCAVCDATFTRQHSLNYHMLIHNNKSRFVCEDCGRNFRHPSHYKEHLRRHTGETPYQCTDCNLRFKTRNTYKRHLKTRHGKILTARGIKILSLEEFDKVRTSPRRRFSKQSLIPRKEDETHWSENTDTEVPHIKTEKFDD